MHTKKRGKQLSVATAQSMLTLAQPPEGSVGDGLGGLSLSDLTTLTESMTMNEMTDTQKELAQEAGQSVGEAAPANKEQDAGSAGETGAGANAKAAVRCLVTALTVIYY